MNRLVVAAHVGLFLGGAAVGSALAAALAPGSWAAAAISFFVLPLAFAVGLQMWYGLALLSLLLRLLSYVWGGKPRPVLRGRSARPALFGAGVFLPLSSAAGAVAGGVVGLLSARHSAWLVLLIYWLVGTLHGLLAWRLARRGILLPPESV